MKIQLISTFIFLSLASVLANADDNCIVIGFHEPHTHKYNGPTFCNQSDLPNLTVHGPLQIRNSVIHGKVNVNGPIDASSTEIGAIQINKQFTSQKITLKKGCKVRGNITFKGLPGIVFKSNNSVIIGKVINGHVKKIKN